jgi:hypothetical protein
MHKGEHDDWEELANVEVLTEQKVQVTGATVDRQETDERTKVLQLAYMVHEKEGKSYKDIATDKVHPAGVAEKWAKFGNPGSLQRAVYRAIKSGEITPV